MKDDLIRRGKIGNDIALYMAENAYLNDTALDVLKMIAKWVNEQPAADVVSIEEYETMKADRDSWKDAFFEFNEIAVKPVITKSVMRRVVMQVPAVDAVEVVRCWECVNGEIDDPDFPDQYYCKEGRGWNKRDFFCAYGVRREDDGELTPCPFCGTTPKGQMNFYGVRVYTTEDAKRFYVQCDICGARTAEKPTPEKAVAVWNWRTNNGEIQKETRCG